MTDSQQADFEAWAVTKGYDLDQVSLLSKPQKFSHYIDPATQKVWEAYQAALQSKDLEDAERLQYLLRKVRMYQTASYGCKFEILNLPPHFGDCEPDPIPPFLAAIDHARRIEGD